MNKKIKILHPIFINPFAMYSFGWIIAIILYFLSPSKLNESLDNGLLLFLSITIFFSFIIAIWFNNKIKGKEIIINYKKQGFLVLSILLFSYILEFVYSRSIPLFSYSSGVFDEMTTSYKEFGIPFFHVLIVSFSIYFLIRSFFNYLCFKEKKNLLNVLCVFLYCILIYSRGIILFTLVILFFLYLSINNMKFSLIKIILFISFSILIMFLFGVLGNIRCGYDWNDSHLIMYYAQIEGDRHSLFSIFYWTWEYIICSLRNLNYNVINFSSNTFELSKFLYSITPDFIAKRIFEEPADVNLLYDAFTTSTMYTANFTSLNYLGMMINFLIYIICVLFIYFFNFKLESKFLIFTTMSFLYLMSIFGNMLIYSGYSFVLIYFIIENIKLSPDYSRGGIYCE